MRARFISICLAASIVLTVGAAGHAAVDPHDDTIGVARTTKFGTIRWYLRNSNSTGSSDIQFVYGNSESDFPVVGDWNGDGKDTVGVAREKTDGTIHWYLRNSNSAGGSHIHLVFGNSETDFPVVGDWNGDGKDTVGVARGMKDGTIRWYLRNRHSTGSSDVSLTYGSVKVFDLPVVGDWNGDGKDTVGVARATSQGWYWALRNSNSSGNPHVKFIYGSVQRDFPIPGDWDGNATHTAGLARVSDRIGWYLRNTNSAGSSDVRATFGDPETDFPVVGDWNG